MKISANTMLLLAQEQKCVGCKACMRGCPMLHRFCANPQDLLKELLEKGEFALELPYSCMLCGYCARVCPVQVDFGRLFLEFRREAVRAGNGRLPKELGQGTIDFHQRFSFSPLFTKEIQALASDTIFFPGCALLSYSPELTEKTFAYLRTRLPGIGYSNKCCAKPTRFMGEEDKFLDYYAILSEEFRARGIRRIITSCQNCYRTLGENSPDIEVVSLWDFFAQDGIPQQRRNIGKELDLVMTLHDPCPTRNVDRIHRSVREILNQLGLDYREMKFNKGLTLCCGSGGMVPVTQNQVALDHLTRRAAEAKTENIITYCQECVQSLRRGGKKTWHILDLLFNEDFLQIPQENPTTLKRWANRYRGKRLHRRD